MIDPMWDVPWPRFIIYKDRKKEYRWRLVARNGKIIADSGEGYSNKGNVNKAVERLQAMLVPRLRIVDDTR